MTYLVIWIYSVYTCAEKSEDMLYLHYLYMVQIYEICTGLKKKKLMFNFM